MKTRFRWKSILIVTAVGIGTLNLLSAQTLTWLGVLPGGAESGALDVSADGTVIGRGKDAYNRTLSFRWAPATSMQVLAPLAGFHESWVYAISADGNHIVGWSRSTAGVDLAAYWAPDGTISALGTLGGAMSWATGVSANGSVIAGAALSVDGRRRAFRWTATEGMHDLGALGGNLSEAYGISADGSTIVGVAREASGYDFAFRWIAPIGMQSLGVFEGGSSSRAYAASADGSTVVGWSRYRIGNFAPYRAFRWTETTGMVNLGELSPDDVAVVARDVSADGAIIVGDDSDSGYRPRAIRWTEATGLQNLNEVYAALLTDSSRLATAAAISWDGRYIVGTGYNGATGRTEGYLLDTWRAGDTNGDGCIDDSDLLAVLFAFGTLGTGLTRHEDINKDGVVDDADLLIVLFNFGQGC